MFPTESPGARVNAVIFDIDGTLVDSNDGHVEAWHEAFRRSGYAISRGAIRLEIGKGADMLIPSLVPDVPETELNQIAQWHDDIFRADYRPRVRPFEGARELIERLSGSGREVALVSSSASTDVDYCVELLDVRSKLRAVVSGDEVRRSKPAGDLFDQVLSRLLPASAEQVLAVGDTPHDVAAAARCHIRTLAVRSGGSSEARLIAAGAAAVFAGVNDPSLLAYLSL